MILNSVATVKGRGITAIWLQIMSIILIKFKEMWEYLNNQEKK